MTIDELISLDRGSTIEAIVSFEGVPREHGIPMDTIGRLGLNHEMIAMEGETIRLKVEYDYSLYRPYPHTRSDGPNVLGTNIVLKQQHCDDKPRMYLWQWEPEWIRVIDEHEDMPVWEDS